MEVLGYGQVSNFTMPMGEWQLTLYVEDSAGNLEIAIQPIRILNRVEFTAEPHIVSGVAISTYSMALEFDEPELPPPGIFYPSAYNRNKEPLVMFNMSMESPYGVNISVDSFEATLDLLTTLAMWDQALANHPEPDKLGEGFATFFTALDESLSEIATMALMLEDEKLAMIEQE